MPVSNNGNVTLFGGERYKALPVNVGDKISVVSRTVLWKDGVDAAQAGQLSFKIVDGVNPPIFTGDIPATISNTFTKIVASDRPGKLLDTIVVTEFARKIFVTEDRDYPSPLGTYSSLPNGLGQGRDSILSITAIDTNKFYDPRSLLFPGIYSELMYSWSVDQTSGLSRWLDADSLPATDNNVYNVKNGALGYFVFRGHPINPYVVPSGETVNVSAYNWPPQYRTLDSLKVLLAKGLITQDVVDQYIFTFPPYFNAEKYDVVDNNARYLQQDTINVGGSTYQSKENFKIFVVNQAPTFIDPSTPSTTLTRRVDRAGTTVPYVVYDPSKYTCDTINDPTKPLFNGMLKANLTDKLRFQADFNTTDEMEDLFAKNDTVRKPVWDFKYGRTAYGFMNVGIATNDTIIIDSTKYDGNATGNNDVLVIQQTRPTWMSNTYLYQFGNETTTDPFGYDVLSAGKINIRIDAATAYNLLKNPTAANGGMNLDTVFTLVANDGHGAITTITKKIYINVVPQIIGEDFLPDAQEDVDYNPELLD
jgi:hypothetical protein